MEDDNKQSFPVGKNFLIKFLNGYASIGVLLVLWGFATIVVNRSAFIEKETYASIYALIQTWANFIGSLFSLIGLIGVCVTAYIKPHDREADDYSLKVSSPIIMAFLIVSIVFLIILKDSFPSVIVLGFTIMGTAGTVFRVLPFSEEEPSTWGTRIEFINIREIFKKKKDRPHRKRIE